MPPASPSHDYVGDLVFGFADPSPSYSHGRDPETSTANSSTERSNETRQSMYVQLFEEMLQTVIDTEPLLFNHEEYKAFGRYDKLTYPARYLFIRLSLRKTDKWVRLSDLKYESEIGPNGIRQAIIELCEDPFARVLESKAEDVKPNVPQPGPEVIDLTADDDDEARGKLGKALQQDQPPVLGYDTFAQNESHATLHELLECLRTDELKELAKQMKAKSKASNRDSLIDALLPTASTTSFPAVVTPTKGKGRGKAQSFGPPQRTLHGHIDPLKPTGKKAVHQMTLHSFVKGGTSKTTRDRLKELVLEKIVSCIKLNENVVSLFRRVNLVYFRSTVPTPLLTPSILARARKWSYAHQPEVKAREPSEQAPPSSFASSSSSATLPSASTSTLGSLSGTPFTSPAPASAPAPAPAPVTGSAPVPSGSTGLPWARTQYKLWPTREDLLRYEWALELEARVDEIFGMAPAPGARRVFQPPSKKGKERERTGSVMSTVERATPAVSAAGRSSVSVPPEKGRLSVMSAASASVAGRDEGRALSVVHEDGAGDDSARVRGAKEVLKIFEEVYSIWLEIPEVKEELEGVKLEAENGNMDADKEAAEHTDGGAKMSEEPQIKTEEAWDVFANLQAIAGVQPVEEPVKDNGAGDTAKQGSESAEEKWLSRFHYGHILTRIVCKGTHALSILKKHERELEVLTKLLSQRAFRRGRRGRWHDRRALILMNHCAKDEQTTRHAWDCVVEALKDEDTHVVWRPMLCRRLARLQKTLRQFGASDIGFIMLGDVEQRKAPKVFIEGERIYATLDEAGNLIIPTKAVKAEAGNANKRRKVEKDDGKQMKLPFAFVAAAPVVKPLSAPTVKRAPTGKSIWRGRDDEEVNVENFALQHYESQGYKGLHSEGRIVTTLFGLLFWDIIFAPVPGAFETRYQMAPLDIAEESFYLARRAMADARLKEIKSGKSLDILCRTWDAHAEKKTFCVGVRWDLLQREDFVEILDCFNSAGLSVICRTLVEDYGSRTGGLPDLFIWHPENKTSKFVEVKGPGDNLQENQKLWIEVLLQAKVPVEVCHVAEHDESKPEGKAKAKAKKGPAKKLKTQSASPTKKRKHADDSDEPSGAILVDSDGDVVPEVDYSQLDQDVVEESEPVSEVVDEPEPVSEAVDELEPGSEIFDEPEPVSDAVDAQEAEKVSVGPELEPEPPRARVQKARTPEVTATPSPRRSTRPRKETNYDVVRRFEDMLGPVNAPGPSQRVDSKPATAKSSPARPKPVKKPRREPSAQAVQEVQDAEPVTTSQELKRTQEFVTRPDDDTDVEDEQIAVPQTPSRRTVSRMQVEVLIQTPSPARRKRKRDGSST
ncbi:VRR-NUC domain-containing protein [Phanerochaete sordida]|uniref:Fanconi-associated nuclease n=1 Tax=Phanerochaete sordida TaxID=48140 RepID=A0A9P3LIJ3_9APHY|nr:VRR-NUC domain-containing protein [Phanerochaete sordida]